MKRLCPPRQCAGSQHLPLEKPDGGKDVGWERRAVLVSVSWENLTCLHSTHSQSAAALLGVLPVVKELQFWHVSSIMLLYYCILYPGHRLQVVHPRSTIIFFLIKRTQIFVEGSYMSSNKNYLSQPTLDIAGANDTVWPMRCKQKLLGCRKLFKRKRTQTGVLCFPFGFPPSSWGEL